MKIQAEWMQHQNCLLLTSGKPRVKPMIGWGLSLKSGWSAEAFMILLQLGQKIQQQAAHC